jgi:hypothetical protein
MNESSHDVTIALRIPGNWGHPGELLERLPAGYRLTPESLTLPDGAKIEFVPMEPDDQFAGIFASSCRRPASKAERAAVDSYSVNICLSGPGGSIDAAKTMMRAAAAIIEAGGAGVFIDNSGLAHGGSDWKELTDDGGTDALTFAFVSIVRGKSEVWTMGMHILGFPEFVIQEADIGPDGDELIEVMRYVCDGGQPIGVGHLLADEFGPRFQTVAAKSDRFTEGSPMYNPFGRLKLVNVKDIAEGN